MTEQNDFEPHVSVFVGTPDNDPNDYLYVQLELDGLTIFIDSSNDSVETLSPDTFLDVIGKLLNTALLVSRQLFIEISLDESIEDLAEEIKPGLFHEVKKMLEETK